MRTGTRICKHCEQEFTGAINAKWCPECQQWAYAQRQQRGYLAAKHPCADCGELVADTSVRCQPCEHKRRGIEYSGPKSANWRGGRHLNKSSGYVQVYVSPGKRLPEHRIVWEKANGPIPDGYVIHHFNGIKDDNRLENLVAMPRWEHSGPRSHINPAAYEARIRELESRLRELES
jgi:hypothetical protein